MKIMDGLKLAIKVGTFLAVATGIIVSQPEPPQRGYESEIDVTPLSMTTSTTTATTTSTTVTSTTTTSSTTTSSTTTTTATTTELTTTAEPVATEPAVETETVVVIEEIAPVETEPAAGAPGSLIRGGMRGTYYSPGSWNNYSAVGGSGRSLLDCNSGGDGYAKGSIASGYLYNLLGYYQNGGRTTVWLEVSGYPDMSGLYYLDDCSGADVIDFFYNANSNCQFNYDGVVSVDVYYAN